MNIKKYLDNTTQTSEGVIYINEEAFDKRCGICHIGEYALETLANAVERGEDLTDEELVENGVGDTYQTIIEEVERYWDEFDDEVKETCTKEDIARMALQNANWTCVSTQIVEMTY